MVTLSGICGPLCSSPTTTGMIVPDPTFRTSCPFSGMEKSNCLTSVAKNVCSSMTLFAANCQSISSSILFEIWPQRGETHANRHPMQPLGPPEKVALNHSNSVHSRCREQIIALRTDYHRPQRMSQAFRLYQTTVPVGIRERPVPKRPCSCEPREPASIMILTTGMKLEMKNVQVVSNR